MKNRTWEKINSYSEVQQMLLHQINYSTSPGMSTKQTEIQAIKLKSKNMGIFTQLQRDSDLDSKIRSDIHPTIRLGKIFKINRNLLRYLK